MELNFDDVIFPSYSHYEEHCKMAIMQRQVEVKDSEANRIECNVAINAVTQAELTLIRKVHNEFKNYMKLVFGV